jgi:hypothetical protein
MWNMGIPPTLNAVLMSSIVEVVLVLLGQLLL